MPIFVVGFMMEMILKRLQRRLNVREEHLKKISRLKMAGEYLFGGAILDDNEIK